MHPRFLLALSLPLLGALTGAHAAERQAMLPGGELTVSTPCARSVAITSDPALHDQVQVQATADNQQELDRLAFQPAGSARSTGAWIGHDQRECWQPSLSFGFSPTLVLTVRVPPGSALTIEDGAVARYTIGDLGGPLKLDLSGAGEVDAASASGLHLDLSGAGTIKVQRVSGAASVGLSGHGQVDLAQVALDKLDADLSGMGAVTVGGGKVGSATLDVSGAGAITVDAETGDASVSLSGLGKIRFARVTGTLKKDVSGMGSVSVGSNTTPR